MGSTGPDTGPRRRSGGKSLEDGDIVRAVLRKTKVLRSPCAAWAEPGKSMLALDDASAKADKRTRAGGPACLHNQIQTTIPPRSLRRFDQLQLAILCAVYHLDTHLRIAEDEDIAVAEFAFLD